jgi:hypothetical protein
LLELKNIKIHGIFVDFFGLLPILRSKIFTWYNIILNNDTKIFLKVQRWDIYLFIYIFLGNNWMKSIAWKGRWEKKFNPHKLLKDKLLNQYQTSWNFHLPLTFFFNKMRMKLLFILRFFWFEPVLGMYTNMYWVCILVLDKKLDWYIYIKKQRLSLYINQ